MSPTFRIVLLPLLSASLSIAAVVSYLPDVQINASKVDSSGNIFLAGQTTTAYIAKLSPQGAVFYTVTLGGTGSSVSAATALDIDSTGAVYIAGTTTATDFPVSPGVTPSPGATAFAAKLDPNGKLIYSALIGGNAKTQPSSVAVNSKKEMLVSGQLVSAQPGSYTASLFLLKLSADGTQTVTGPANVGGLLTLDAQDNVYVAGVPPAQIGGSENAFQSTDPPSTAGAFQSQPATYICGCPFFEYACGGDQFAASLTSDLSRTRFLTYLTAKYGATPAYIGLDPQGNILIAGTTSAPGYPTTPGSYQPKYNAASGTTFTCGPPIDLEFTSPSGYVSSLKPDGSGLIFSTFFSGSKNDRLTFAALTSAGIYLAGQANSLDLPGLDGAAPSQCAPVGFLSRMTLDGSAVTQTRTPPGTPLAYDSTTGTILLASGSYLLRFDPSQSTPIACLLDAADLLPVTTIAPGELLSMFGRFQYFVTDPFTASINPVNGSFPTGFQGLSVKANQASAPLLYASAQQIDFQAPYEIAGSAQASVAVTYSDVNGNSISDARQLTVAATNPVAFLSQPSNGGQAVPVILNADGTVNSATNPAAVGTMVTIFLDGLGVTSPQPVTGLVDTAPATPLNLSITVAPYCSGTNCLPAPVFVSANQAVGSISGVTQVQLRAPATISGSEFLDMFSLSVGSTAVRDLNLSFWVK